MCSLGDCNRFDYNKLVSNSKFKNYLATIVFWFERLVWQHFLNAVTKVICVAAILVFVLLWSGLSFLYFCTFVQKI